MVKTAITASPKKITIPARYAKAALVKKRQHIKVINTHGTQVVDCWALNTDNMTEFMSMEHCRVSLERVYPRKGDTMVTNRRRPILKIMQDSTSGTHDTLLAACDLYRYQLLGCQEYHRNCTDNFWEAMVEIGMKPVELPSPFNLWQNTPVEAGGGIKPNPPDSKRGDYIVLRAEMDLVICLSACPQDITSICGNKPRNAHFEIY
ncbi:MAG: urea carboxylase-associated family protein [Gammaproteobacteria bacterium]|nr:urea carboxylase-associated family protein [Gammaproteobacteria bacterium]